MRFPIFGIGTQGKSPNVTAQHRLNLYMDVQPQEDKTKISLHQRPGKPLFASLGSGNPVRGMHVVGVLMYVVHLGIFYEISADGVATSRGTLNTTTGRVSMDDNHAGVIMIVDGTNGYLYTISSNTFAEITDPDYNDDSQTVTYHDGYFLTPKVDTGQFYLSSADATSVSASWDALDFATAEKDPDNLVRVFSNNTEILLCSEQVIEWWNDTGAVDFPYARVTGGVIELGLASKEAITRFGASSTMLLAVNGQQGDVQVIKIDGFSYKSVSNPEIDTIFNRFTTSDASAFSYTIEGHPFFQISFPTDEATWLYDGLTNLWSELSYAALGARDRAELGINFLNKMFVGDFENGDIYKLDPDVFTDDGVPIVVEVTCRHIFDEKYSRLSRLWVDMEAGVGLLSGQGSDPKLTLEISKDGGHVYGTSKVMSLGKAGKFNTRSIRRRLGRSYDWVFRLRCSEPVKKVFVGAWVDTVA